MSIGRTPAVLGRRACAVLAACSAALHGVLLGHAANPAMMAAMVAMMIACLFCARDLWRRGSLGVWCAVALMNLAMIALHMPMPTHHHGLGVASAPSAAVDPMTMATMLALVEVVIAAAVLAYRTRHRSLDAVTLDNRNTWGSRHSS
ncbi:hypothetical protein BTO20_29510 [Mycobacterium dioxanotrophicus]|jgi:hypothetical protein|uniref:Uncharacterized protein n=1 Tax=Mycobacterium dioxanotrophicus TaxID=482462 RepID=A0A1Y0CA74_9MYCO|nr:hypothetical protein [Mycobacterium dioxanotrophicus]ART72139.1 hypothetical protein BTO20_29510 [Mycobacterium dioxanotrophicus]